MSCIRSFSCSFRFFSVTTPAPLGFGEIVLAGELVEASIELLMLLD